MWDFLLQLAVLIYILMGIYNAGRWLPSAHAEIHAKPHAIKSALLFAVITIAWLPLTISAYFELTNFKE
jgi:formate hydrogenlyase subunit 3/multisubunit Na+/H+ antiporter MnhD subunit